MPKSFEKSSCQPKFYQYCLISKRPHNDEDVLLAGQKKKRVIEKNVLLPTNGQYVKILFSSFEKKCSCKS